MPALDYNKRLVWFFIYIYKLYIDCSTYAIFLEIILFFIIRHLEDVAKALLTPRRTRLCEHSARTHSLNQTPQDCSRRNCHLSRSNNTAILTFASHLSPVVKQHQIKSVHHNQIKSKCTEFSALLLFSFTWYVIISLAPSLNQRLRFHSLACFSSHHTHTCTIKVAHIVAFI